MEQTLRFSTHSTKLFLRFGQGACATLAAGELRIHFSATLTAAAGFGCEDKFRAGTRSHFSLLSSKFRSALHHHRHPVGVGLAVGKRAFYPECGKMKARMLESKL